MSFSHWLLFVAAALATTFSPGPALLLAVSNAIGLGARQAAFSSLGNAAGLFALAALTWLGVGAADRVTGVPFSLPTFFWRSKRKPAARQARNVAGEEASTASGQCRMPGS